MTLRHYLTVERDGDVAEVTLRRPEVRNAVNQELHDALVGAVETFSHDTSLRAVVLAAEGHVFSAGGDFEWMARCHADLPTRDATVREGLRLLEALTQLDVPVVAAMQGDAIGLGASLVLSCDAVVAKSSAKLADPHVAIGLVAGDGGCLLWPQAAGMLRARRYLLTGDPIPASLAHDWGLVTDLVDNAEDVLPAARALAARLAALPPLAVRGTKRALNQVMAARFAEVAALAGAEELTTLGSDDLLEAIDAFKDKRVPKYHGR
ncbi:enoyl-CoA hydratase/isomerase family protein [Rhodococcus sp. DMU1]|uniref:enoyl-CoA hydratase/isomerase family protein n=1 Tax=Rhodococcus sp. DMU1 TaxID=2722825 RepID=UPI00143EC0B9|nr:enoyl-CoA hydratase/isomerase family protein [Rhodococcus sp. DMU1]QIX53869.1 enoyl-CoA hydratase/isomerase family protein [Rhodococcus sp. DMU1]